MKKLISLVGLGAAVACGPLMLSAAHWYPMRDNVVSLNGTWDFRLYEAEPGSTNEVEINSGKIAVPGNWETQGFIRPRYKRHYQKDYAGVCTRTFAYDPSWKGRRVILRFDAVYFGFTLKVNGRDFGLTTHAPNLHQFDITEALREGTNEIEVKVLTSQVRDWLFDINDCWAIAGITRDVQIFTTGPNWVSDVVFTPTNSPADYVAKCDSEVTFDDETLQGNLFEELAVDCGAGLRLDLGMLVVRFDVGVPLHDPNSYGSYFNCCDGFFKNLAYNLAVGYPF